MSENITIPLTIYTEYSLDNGRERAKIQIEQTLFHIAAIAYFMKLAARGHSLLEIQTDSVLVELPVFAANVDYGCQLIEALTQSVDLPLIGLTKKTEAQNEN